MNKEELLKMAREAGFVTGEMHNRDGESTYTLIKTTGHGCTVEVRNLINLLLERAAVECDELSKCMQQDDHMQGCIDSAHAIRALKTENSV